MRTRRRSALGVHALLLGLASCTGQCDPRPVSESADVPPAEESVVVVAVDGCATQRADEGCMRPAPGHPTMCEGTRATRGGFSFKADMPMSLVIWADRHGTLTLDGEPVATPADPIDGGLRWHVEVPTSARTLQLHCVEGEPPCWSMPLGTSPPEPESLAAARALRAVPVDAAGLVLRHEMLVALEAAMPAYSPEDRRTALDVATDARFQAARVERDPDRRREAYREALEWTTQAFEGALAHGEIGRASCHARRALRYSLEDLGDTGRASDWRRRVAALSEVSPLAAAKNEYYAGVVFQREGDLQAARAAYLRAERGARRFNDKLRGSASVTMAATVLAALGQETEVEALFERARADREQLGCLVWLRMLNNHSYSRYQLSALGRPAADPVPDLDEVLMLVGLRGGRDPCYSAELEEHARLNLGLVAIERGWTGEASQLLEVVEDGEPGPSRRFWVELLRQRIVLANGERGALIELAMRREPLRPGVPAQQHWLHEHGRGRAFEALGLPGDAVVAYQAAERSLDAMMRALDFDTTYERLLRGRQSSAGRLVALLAAHGRSQEALCMARRARRRTHDALDRPARISALREDERERWREGLSQVQQRRRALDTLTEQTWSIPTDALGAHAERVAEAEALLDEATARAQAILYGGAREASSDDACEGWQAPGRAGDPGRAPREISLLYFPVDSDERRWQGFAFDAQGVRATALLDPPRDDDAPLSQWSEALLDPFAEVLDSATGVRVLPTGRLWTVPFAALPWKGDILLAHVPVATSLDLAQRPPASMGEGTALVVGDPRGDLPAARREAAHVVASLEAEGWTVQSLAGQQVRPSELRTHLPEVDLLHYAGHAEHGGTDGWGSALRLSGDGRLEVRDVMALSRVPPVVMLPACDTASIAPGTLGGGMSIARAFLLAGADVVVASQDLLDDQLGLALAEALYEPGSGGIEVEAGPAALQRAVLKVRDRFSPHAWWPVVVLVP